MSTIKVEQTVLESIKNRRSVYPEVFTDELVTKEELEQLLEMANYAPNHKLTQPWRFKVAAGDRKTDFAEAMVAAYEAAVPAEKQLPKKPRTIRKRAQKSSFMLAICMQRDPKASLPEWEELAAMSMAVQNIWLAGEAMGIGMYWGSQALWFVPKSESFYSWQKEKLAMVYFLLAVSPRDLSWSLAERQLAKKLAGYNLVQLKRPKSTLLGRFTFLLDSTEKNWQLKSKNLPL